jgi:hypothetical protein
LTDQQGGNDARCPSEPPIIPLWPWGVAKIKRKLQERRTKRENESSQERSSRITAKATAWIAVFAVVAAVVAISQAIIANRQLTTMQGQLDAMNREQRPWVTFSKIAVGSDFTYNTSGVGISLDFSLKNVGHSPAFNVSIWPTLVLGNIADPLRAQREYCNDLVARNMTDGGITLFPDQELIPWKHGASVGADDLKRAREAWQGSSLISPYMVGCILYRIDGVTAERQTGFIYEIDRIARESPVSNARVAIDTALGNIKAQDIGITIFTRLGDGPTVN